MCIFHRTQGIRTCWCSKCESLSLPYLANGSVVKNVWDLRRNEKNTSLNNFTIPTVGRTDVSLQRPTTTNTTIADHGHRRQKWPPSAPHEALHSNPMHRMDGQQPPKQVDIIFGAVEGVYGSQNTPMLWQCIIAGTKERFEGHTHPQSPPKIRPLAWRVVAHPSDASAGSAKPHVEC